MTDIAHECNVTKMTVSRVLAGHNGVKPSTRKKVMEAAKRLNYEVNILAKNFNFNRSGFIGVATPFSGLLGSPYFAEAFKGFCQAVQGTKLDFALFDTNSDLFNDGAKLARLWRQRRVDGLLIVALHTYDRFLDTLADHQVPMVVVGETADTSTVCSVFCNDEKGIEMMCAHLYALGHRRIAFVEGPRFTTSANRRTHAYAKFCRSKGLNNPGWYIQAGNYSMHSGREAGLILLRGKPRPTAIIAANDIMAFGVIESARELKLRMPEDLSVGGFDDLPNAADNYPSLTTVHQPVNLMAEHGAKILLQSIKTGVMPTGKTVMQVSLVERQSTATCK